MGSRTKCNVNNQNSSDATQTCRSSLCGSVCEWISQTIGTKAIQATDQMPLPGPGIESHSNAIVTVVKISAVKSRFVGWICEVFLVAFRAAAVRFFRFFRFRRFAIVFRALYQALGSEGKTTFWFVAVRF